MWILLDKGLLCIYFGYFYSDFLYNLCDICICNYFGLLYKFCYFGMDQRDIYCGCYMFFLNICLNKYMKMNFVYLDRYYCFDKVMYCKSCIYCILYFFNCLDRNM